MRILVLLIAWVPLVVAAEELPHVDASLREQRSCRLAAGAFPDERHGWLADMCGGVFETTDAGESWRKLGSNERGLATGEFQHIAEFVWPTPRVGVALLYGVRNSYRTTDGGATWSAVEMPVEQWPYAADRIAHHIWTCGSAGKIVRSDDDGATWRETATPFDDDNRCMSLSFLDDKNGWAGGMNGSIYATTDAGASWHKINSPAKDDAKVLRYTSSSAWVSSRAGLFATVDGGANWTAVKLDGMSFDRIFASHSGARTIFTFNRAATTAELVPVLHGDAAAWGANGAVMWGRATWLVDFFRDGERVRSSPIVSRIGAKTDESLSGVTTIDANRRFGWSQGHIYHSEDGGRTWFVVGDTPGTPKRLQFLDERSAVAETDRGWFGSRDGGRSWQPSQNAAWDQHQLEAATGASTAGPLACTLSSSNGSLELSFGFRGCFGGVMNSLKVMWRSDGSATLTGSLDENSQTKTVNEVLTVARAREILRSINDAVEKKEIPSQCSSTNSSLATLKWSCGGKSQELSFSSSDCARHQRIIGAATQSGRPNQDAYARAIGLNEIGEKTLAAVTKPTAPK